jgi:hypothetical protein
MATASQRPDPLLLAESVGLGLRVRLAWEICLTYARVRRLLARRGIAEVVAELRGGGDDDGLDEEQARHLSDRLHRPVRRTLGSLPVDSRCLMRSLVLLRMLARRGVPCRLSIGAQSGERFAAHAWLEHRGRPIMPTLGYLPLVTL